MTGIWHEDLHARFQEQFEVIRAALALPDPDNPQRLPGIAIAKEPLGHRGDLDVLYQDCGILVHPEYIKKAESQLGARQAVDDEPRNAYRLLKLPEPGARAAIDSFCTRNGKETAGHNFILSITDGTGNICPASEPLPADQSRRQRTQDETDCGAVRIRVIDTGIIPRLIDMFPKLEDVVGQRRLNAKAFADLENVDGRPPLGNDISIYSGHGMFIAGVLRQIAPKVSIYVDNLFRRAGAVTVTGIVSALRDILELPDEEMPHIISLSAGGYFSERSLPMMCDVVRQLQERAAKHGYPILVAAAGNDGHNGERPCYQPFYPAGLPGVISVGALRSDNKGRACFSNHGSWVRVYAPGERIVSLFPSGSYTYHHNGTSACRYLHRRRDPEWYHCCTCVTQPDKFKTKRFDGYAEWSGTSFSTPVVAGLIAREMVKRNTQNALQVATSVLAEQTTTIGGLGNILVPAWWSSAQCLEPARDTAITDASTAPAPA